MRIEANLQVTLATMSQTLERPLHEFSTPLALLPPSEEGPANTADGLDDVAQDPEALLPEPWFTPEIETCVPSNPCGEHVDLTVHFLQADQGPLGGRVTLVSGHSAGTSRSCCRVGRRVLPGYGVQRE